METDLFRALTAEDTMTELPTDCNTQQYKTLSDNSDLLS